MPNFNKTELQLETRLDKWLFFIRNLRDFQSIPVVFKNKAVFEQAFGKAELAKLENWQWETYERNLKDYRDMKGYIDMAFSDGIISVARALKNNETSIKIIMKSTGLSEWEISKL